MKNKFLLCICVLLLLIATNSRGTLPIHEYIILIDISGSMIGKGDGKGYVVLPQVKSAIKSYIRTQIPNDSKIEVILFEKSFLDSKIFYIDDSPESKNEIDFFINELSGTGSMTNIYGALHHALGKAEKKGNAPTMILLFTDGHDNVHEKTIDDIVKYFKGIKDKNPFLFVFYNYLTFPDQFEDEDLNELENGGINVNRLDRTASSSKLQKHLSAIMGQMDEIRKKREQLLEIEKKQKETEEKLIQKEKQLTLKETELQARLKKVIDDEKKREEIQKEIDAIRAEKDKFREEKKNFEKANNQLKEINRLLAEANTLESSGEISKLLAALDKYEAILGKDSKNVRALDGKKRVERTLWERKNFLEKYWPYLAPSFFLFLFLCLVVRRPLKKGWKIYPIKCDIFYNVLDNNKEALLQDSQTFHRKRFHRSGDTKEIGSKYGTIIIPHKSVCESNHATIYRELNSIFIKKEAGNIYKEDEQEIRVPLKLAAEEIVYFESGPVLKEDKPKKKIKVKFIISR
jgi:hypothetical protein